MRSDLDSLAATGAQVIETDPDAPGDLERAIRFVGDLGITGGLVLVIRLCATLPDLPAGTAVACVGPSHHPPRSGAIHTGTAAALRSVLEGQAARRRCRRVPDIDPDPRWTVRLPAGPEARHLAESLGSLSNGRAGSRAALERDDRGGAPLLLVGGVYDGEDRLLAGPVWTDLDLPPSGGAPVRILDLRGGLLARQPVPGDPVRSVRLVSATEPHHLAMRCEVAGKWPAPRPVLRAAPAQPAPFTHHRRDGVEVAMTGEPTGAAIAVAAEDTTSSDGSWSTLERMAAWACSPEDPSPEVAAAGRLEVLRKTGFDALLGAHRRAWAQMWRHAEVSIEGQPADELAARFAVFHLLGAAAGSGESAVGPRGLTGEAYAGHVFWDADVFVLPALAAIRPEAARSMLEYRIRRLPAAREAARSDGLDGARFPWESARDGTDVTPRWVRGPGGKAIPIATGRHELHVVADVAWAAFRYAEWSGDRLFPTVGPGRDLILDTARFWASRIRTDRSGRAHIYGVMGPDEYHETVDDNAFTNVMARWHLRAAARLLTGHPPPYGDIAEATRWRALADALVDGWDPRLRTFEQFAGYLHLEPLMAADVARPPVAIDMVLGHERVAGSQLIKQADVLMLHHMVGDEVPEGSLIPSLDFYGPRTAHGSSLSPAIHASLLARAGRTAEALAMFRLAARLDLDDVTATSGAGLHVATMGGLWQALAYGFLGMRVGGGTLSIDPHLPAEWSALAMKFRLAGAAVEVRADRHGVRVGCDRPIRIRIGTGEPRIIEPPGARVTHPFT